MSLSIKSPRGTNDSLVLESYTLEFIENLMLETSYLYGFGQVRTPVFEHTELFLRCVGETTDVVSKEMYTFKDKGDRSITLKPEGTAGLVRAVLQHNMLQGISPLKLCYVTPCFRYEKPQSGRLRQFHQFGIEMIGSKTSIADVEAICLANEIFSILQIKNLKLELNSIGCSNCRETYHNKLKEFLNYIKNNLCETCNERFDKNPMRILDCKNSECNKLTENAPVILDCVCDECKEHFEQVKAKLDYLNIKYTVNPKIVRGLDYYTKTVFEFISEDLGAKATVCGGGRYDNLVELLGGPKKTHAIGFAIGIERLILILKNQNIELPKPRKCELYIGSIGDVARLKSMELTKSLRSEGFYVECDLMDKNVKGQMKFADKINAKFSIVLGDDEINSGKCNIKNMCNGEILNTKLEKINEILYNEGIKTITQNLENNFNINHLLGE